MKEGDLVFIDSSKRGNHYDSHINAASEMRLKRWKSYTGLPIDPAENYRIIGFCTHDNGSKLVGIESCTHHTQHIMDRESLVIIESELSYKLSLIAKEFQNG